MSAPQVVAKKNEEPILIIDREGLIGEKLAQNLKEEATVVLVSQKVPKGDNLLHIFYDKKIPQIPDNRYSHIFVIDDGEASTRVALSSFLEKATNDNAVFILVTKMQEINEKLIDDVTSYYQKAKIAFYGEIFGAELSERVLSFEKDSYTNRFLYQASLKNKILIPGNAATIYSYPVFFEDLISGILEAVFGQNEDRIFYLFPKHPPSLLSLARMIQKSNPNITLDFVKEEKANNLEIPEKGKYLLSEKYLLDEKIKQSLRSYDLKKIDFEKKEMISDEEEEFTEEKKSLRLPSFSKQAIFLVLFLILFPVIATSVLSILGEKSLSSIESYLDDGDFEKAKKSAFFAKNYFDWAENFASVTPFWFFKDPLEKGQNKAISANSIFNGLSTYDFSDIKKGLVYLQKEKVKIPFSNFTLATIDVWQDLLGFKNEKTYLLLLQDDREIRPTGGLIESYGLLRISKGKIQDLSIESVDKIDKNLKGHVEPPYPIRRYLKTTNWSFRDSNFNIDFTEAASTSAFFLNVLKDKKVDGVLAIKNSLFNEVESEFKSGKPHLYKILKRLEKAIFEKDIVFAFNDGNIQNIFTFNKWSGSLWDQRKEDKNIANDFLGINEANLGKNKIDNSISRSVSQNTKIDDDGSIRSVLNINYKNQAGAIYKNYLRTVLPINTVIDEIKIDGEIKDRQDAITNPSIYEAKNFKEPKSLEIEKENFAGKTVYGFFVTVDPKSSKEIQITYTISKKIVLDQHFAYKGNLESFTYSLKIFKQPGVSYPYSFNISFPSEFKLTKGPASFKKEILNDEEISFDLVKR